MKSPNDTQLRQVDTHFDFGRNWASFAAGITAEQIDQAVSSLARLLPATELQGASFFDIGCGSGLSLLAEERVRPGPVHGWAARYRAQLGRAALEEPTNKPLYWVRYARAQCAWPWAALPENSTQRPESKRQPTLAEGQICETLWL